MARSNGRPARVRDRDRRSTGSRAAAIRKLRALPKAPTGVHGLDEITGGGLPRGRPTLVCGGPGCGKTLLAMEFLVHGATRYDEPGVFMAFEETAEDLAQNVASLGFDLPDLVAKRRLAIDYVRVERSEIEETGEYDLEGLFIRLEHAIDSVKAKRVVLDTIESLFSGLPNPLVLRSELRRLFRWLKERGMTAVITAERGEGHLTRHGLEEYVSDCVLSLDHRVEGQSTTRRLRVVKYRGSVHGTNEYPFLIDQNGLSVLPITSAGLAHKVSGQRISTGIPRLDEMLGGRGVYRGSTVLVSGTAGTGKTTVAASFALAACRRGERCLVEAFEESPDQLVRNMRSVGIDLGAEVEGGRLEIHASRPTAHGLEMHLVMMHKTIERHRPDVVVVDPISNLVTVGNPAEALSLAVRLIDFLKGRGITCVFTDLTAGGDDLEQSDVGVSSLVDTWLMLQTVRVGGERNRTLSIIKSRGMAHSNQACEYTIGRTGLLLADTYLGADGVLTGSLRRAREETERATAENEKEETARRARTRERRRRGLERRIEELKDRLEEEVRLERQAAGEDEARLGRAEAARTAMARTRRAFAGGNGEPSGTRRR